MLPLYDELNVPYEVLTAAEIRQRWPDLVVREGDVGLLDPRAGYSEPDEYIPSSAGEARRLGVELQEHTTVCDLMVRDGRIAGVRTARGDVAADAVVLATHAWTNLIRTGLRGDSDQELRPPTLCHFAVVPYPAGARGECRPVPRRLRGRRKATVCSSASRRRTARNIA